MQIPILRKQRAGITILVPDNKGFRAKNINRDQKSQFHNHKGGTH